MAAPTKPAKPKTVSVRGCATKGVPDFCTVIKGPKGVTYNVSGANPPVPVGKLVRLTGTPSDKMSPCQGSVLDGVKFTELKGKCPK